MIQVRPFAGYILRHLTMRVLFCALLTIKFRGVSQVDFWVAQTNPPDSLISDSDLTRRTEVVKLQEYKKHRNVETE